ncbi:hypothetical protein QE422_002921 [Chryseobacterium sp. SORGH_AS 447]|uniref:DMP19 family protein n=1 Tax=Chryseobacterium sp. SORGH_AS_0447 TaxID=3041769 RepID=UPI00278810A3|nr:DUF4375 domain-containing protein [Chryseobacterium sp. SORGH_AS_0447]MDQ1162553.1 hypothetical protein [Chryseobacterium sp. SORGH_AS_0447]
MKNEEISSKYYANSVKGLNDKILNDKDLWYDYINDLPQNLQVTYTIIIYHEQVFNGGLHQYFFNSYGQFAYLTIENLKLIKAFEASKILEKAVEIVNSEHYDIEEFRTRIFSRKLEKITEFDDEIFDSLEKLDDEYYDLDEDLEQLLVDYLQNHLKN